MKLAEYPSFKRPLIINSYPNPIHPVITVDEKSEKGTKRAKVNKPC